jgi:hypothetical protein
MCPSDAFHMANAFIVTVIISNLMLQSLSGCCAPELLDRARHVCRYLCGTAELELMLGGSASLDASPPVFSAWSDCDFSGCPTIARSVAGIVLFYRGSLVLWRSVKLGTIVKSATSAEYVAASLTSDEVVFVRSILAELGHALSPTLMLVDDSAAVSLLDSGKVDGKTKYLAVHWHCVRERVCTGIIDVKCVSTDQNLAYLFTKPLAAPKLRKFRAAMGLGSECPFASLCPGSREFCECRCVALRGCVVHCPSACGHCMSEC